MYLTLLVVEDMINRIDFHPAGTIEAQQEQIKA